MDRGATSNDQAIDQQDLAIESQSHNDYELSIPQARPPGHHITIDDWSSTGRGSHVDFADTEPLPLQQGRLLGRGSMGDVYETKVQGWTLAHKRMVFRRKIGEKERREIDILKRISHNHILQLIGTYTQQRVVGILMFPVAVCDLHTFFEDVEAWSISTAAEQNSTSAAEERLDPAPRARLKALNYDFPPSDVHAKASPIYHQVGCLISAVAYLHERKIRHKDLKPSNILLSRDKLWLSDFGSATDFTLLSQSATDNERGTPRYFAPEVADWKPNGRSADVFSLGCVLLEILVMHETGQLERIRHHRSSDPSFHANLDRIDEWLQVLDRKISSRRYHLTCEVRHMLSWDPTTRPVIQDLLSRVVLRDLARERPTQRSIFGICCQGHFISEAEHNRRMSRAEEQIARLTYRLHATQEELRKEREKAQKLAKWALNDIEDTRKGANGNNFGVPRDTTAPPGRWEERKFQSYSII